MKIPLDYYRILGLPIQATAEQLQQAHRDRTLQLPRREYSEAAIAARKQLLDEAYAVLSHAEQRKAYDAGFLAKSYDLASEATEPTATGNVVSLPGAAAPPDVDPYTPSIEIQDPQLVGALLILLELGEYELVLKLGRPYLSSGSLSSLNSGRFGQPDIVRADIVLTIAFACLELGREQWQQGQYENAAESLETGQELLLREGLFASVRGEMQSDLFKLRPYRVLELLALPEESDRERQQGLTLLRDMLQDRGGIDGTGDDQSGLNVDDFLRFIQQLRSYLTSAEQQVLFEAEARRPSAVATYLAVYALLARGFAYRQPALIRRAKLMLIRLGTRQDVHLEQAVCALLLGQTEEASRALELSQEYESLAFIREHSQGSPDLLPGLCLYGERWLQSEVFPHFRDLAKQQVSLKDYFADEQVQAYLEELPNEPEPVNQWAAVRSAPIAARQTAPGREVVNGTNRSFAPSVAPAATAATVSTATYANGANGNAAMMTAKRVSDLSPEGRLGGSDTGKGRSRTLTGDSHNTATESRTARESGGSENRRSANTMHVPQVDPLPARRSGNRRSAPRLDRLMFLIALGVVGLGIVWIVGSWLARTLGGPTPQGEQLQVQVDRPPVTIPAPSPVAASPDPNAPLTNETAQQVISTWLSTKAAAMGSNHATDRLAQILVEPALSTWQRRSQEAQNQDWYFEYQHGVEVSSVTVDPTDANQAQVEAQVTETANYYSNGQPDVANSYDDNLRVSYDLIRQNGKWFVQDMTVLGEGTPVEPLPSATTTSPEELPPVNVAPTVSPTETVVPRENTPTGASPDAIAPQTSPSP